MSKVIRSKEVEENNLKEYFYVINYPTYEKSLCDMEMRYIFNRVSDEKQFCTNIYVNPSRSPFIKHSISIMYSGDNLQDIVNKVTENNLHYEGFKVFYIKSENGDVEYSERLRSVREIGLAIGGECEMHNPKVTFAVSKIDGRWIFGIYEQNDYKWHEHNNKPHSYSNALSLRVAKAIVNIAVGNNLNCTLIDPCCGIGTVVIEALDLGIKVKGYELSKQIAGNARENLKFLGLDDVISNTNMHSMDEKFDVAIVDIPYGLFTATTLKEQIDIIKTSRKIADKLVIVTFENMDKHIISQGFDIIDQCCVSKSNFVRYITLCK